MRHASCATQQQVIFHYLRLKLCFRLAKHAASGPSSPVLSKMLLKSLNPQGDPMTYYHRANCKDSNAASIACLRSPVGKAWPRVAMERLYGRRTGRHAGGGKPTGLRQVPGEPGAFPDAAVRPLFICPSPQWQPQDAQPIRPFTFQHLISAMAGRRPRRREGPDPPKPGSRQG